jgi:hypothetical protein
MEPERSRMKAISDLTDDGDGFILFADGFSPHSALNRMLLGESQSNRVADE